MNAAQRIVLLLFAFSLLAAVATGGMLYIRLSYLWGVVFFGGWAWSALALRGLKLTRKPRSLRAQVGQVFEEQYEIRNHSRLPHLWLEIVDKSSLPGSRGSHVLTLIESRQGRTYLARTRLVRRGAFSLGPTVMASGDLFGLFPVGRVEPAVDTLLVYPHLVEVSAFPSPPGLLPGGQALRRRTHQVTPNAVSVREYAPGDPLNRIHWASTARRERFMVKEFELDPMADVWIFLDAEQASQASLPQATPAVEMGDLWRRPMEISLPPATEEYGVTIAASLARYYIRRDRAVGLVSVGQHVTLIPPDRGGRQLGKMLDALALSKAEGTLPFRALVEAQARNLMRGSTVILITPSAQMDLAVLTDNLVRQGLRPVVVLLAAETFGGPSSSLALAAQLRAQRVPVCRVENGDNLSERLSSVAEAVIGASF